MHKLFNRNTLKVSYSCTPNVGSIMKSHKEKLTNAENKQNKNCNCRKEEECQLEGNCRSKDIICKCVVTAAGHPRKAYLGTAEGNFQQRYYSDKKTIRNHKYANETSLSKYICKMKDKHNVCPNLFWCIVKSVPGYSNISKRCMLCLHEKYEILKYPDQDGVLSKSSELVSECRHVNKFFLPNYQSISVLIN